MLLQAPNGEDKEEKKTSRFYLSCVLFNSFGSTRNGYPPRFDVMRVFRYYYLCHSLLGCYDVEVTLIDEGGHDSS